MEYRTRKMVMDKDLNPAGTLFGGRALEWIDEEAAIFAYCQLKYPIHLVTKVMSTIDFKAPARKGEIVEIGMEVVKVGKTSITVGCSLRNKRTQQEIVKVAEIVFVNLDETGKPAPHGHYQLPEDFKAVAQNVGETPKRMSPGVQTTIVDIDHYRPYEECPICKTYG
jgi:acyl-CoA hydrolase